jgi:AraC-like DNA-binding protein
MENAGILRYFYILGFVNALFFSFLILSKRHKKLSDKLLASWLIILSLHLLFPFLYLSDIKTYYQYAGLEVCFYALHPLFLHLYITSIIGQFPSRKKLIYIVIAAFLVEISLLSFFLIPSEVRLALILGKQNVEPYLYLIGIPICVQFLYYFIASIKALKHYKLNVLQIYSYKEDVELLWLRRLFLFFYSLLLLTFPLMIYFYYNNISLAFGDYYYFAGLSIFIFFIGYWGYKHGDVFSLHEENTPPIIVEETAINKNIYYNIPDEKIDELKRMMERQKPFLNPALTIYELAQMIDIQPHQLSKLISQKFKCNFFEFINHHRIEMFKKYLIDSKFKDYTLLAIALECGFNSKSAFNRIFKEQTGQTPTEFKKNLSFSKVLKN